MEEDTVVVAVPLVSLLSCSNIPVFPPLKSSLRSRATREGPYIAAAAAASRHLVGANHFPNEFFGRARTSFSGRKRACYYVDYCSHSCSIVMMIPKWILTLLALLAGSLRILGRTVVVWQRSGRWKFRSCFPEFCELLFIFFS